MHRFWLVGTIPFLLLLSLPSVAASNGAERDRYTLQNGYIRLSGENGGIDRFQVDPEGKGHYGANWIRSFRIGAPAPNSSQPFHWQMRDATLQLTGVPVRRDISRSLYEGQSVPQALKPGMRLGQRFRSEWAALTRVQGSFPTWHTQNSGFTMTLRRNGPDGEIIASKRFINIKDNSDLGLEFSPQPPGLYYLEISDAVGTPGWWSLAEPASEEETGFIDGKPAPMCLSIKLDGYNLISANWELKLDENRLQLKAENTGGAPLWLTTPWLREGYVTEDPQRIMFRHFISNDGIYRPVHQFKRKPEQTLTASQWIEMCGTRGFNLRFCFPKSAGIVWNMDSDSMSYRLDLSESTLEVRKFDSTLPDMFPAFFSSDPKMDGVLNQFLYSHGLNFGIGCPPDWKEWQPRIICWTKNPQKDAQAGHLRSYGMREDGYVLTWGANEGWPFPYKDDNKDGKNDFDTRHFTTNPCYISGCATHALWTRDREFLKAVLPRVRKAMEFQLNQLHGSEGIILIDAKGHEGRAEGIGSNYWDILPFGYKDAFCNSYYYGSLESMAQMEELARKWGLPCEGARTPEYYRELEKRVRADYQRDFWDDSVGRFVGCVDVDGSKHDYGFTFINVDAMSRGLADPDQAKRIYHWMETEPTSSGKPDTYSRWIIAPRAATFNNPRRDEPQTPKPSWWHSGWGGTDFDGQCQAGGAILYTSHYDLLARAKYLGADNAYKRFSEILARYALPDHLSGGNPLYLGESSQGGGNGAGSIGVEGEFPESGLVPVSFLYAFMGVQVDAEGLKIRPNLPSALSYAGVRNLCYGGRTYEIQVTNELVTVRCTDPGSHFSVRKSLRPGETFLLDRYLD